MAQECLQILTGRGFVSPVNFTSINQIRQAKRYLLVIAKIEFRRQIEREI